MQHLSSLVVPPVRPTLALFILPVRLAPAFTPVLLPVKLVPWLAVDQVFHQIVLLFLDSYEVLFTKDKLSKYLTYAHCRLVSTSMHML